MSLAQVEPILGAHPAAAFGLRDYLRGLRTHVENGRGIWFTGDPGTGKTTVAMVISKAAMEADLTVAIYSLPRLLSVMRETFDDTSRHSLTELIDLLASVDLLHLDDLGAEQSTPWVLEQLYTIINTRYEDGKALLLTTNQIASGPVDVVDSKTGEPARDPETGGTKKEPADARLRRQIGDRTVSRIYEVCGVPLPMFGDDRRLEVGGLTPDWEGPGQSHSGADAAILGAGRGRWVDPAERAWDDADPDQPSGYGRPRAQRLD